MDHIAAGRLVRLLPHHASPLAPVHIVFPADRAGNRAIRALIEKLTPHLRRELRVET